MCIRDLILSEERAAPWQVQGRKIFQQHTKAAGVWSLIAIYFEMKMLMEWQLLQMMTKENAES